MDLNDFSIHSNALNIRLLHNLIMQSHGDHFREYINKWQLLVLISMLSQIIRWQGIQTDFVTFGTKPKFIKVVLMKLEQERASWYVHAIPKPSSIKRAIFMACKRQCFTQGRTTFVKTNGAEDKPKGRTVNTKYFVAPLIS